MYFTYNYQNVIHMITSEQKSSLDKERVLDKLINPKIKIVNIQKKGVIIFLPIF